MEQRSGTDLLAHLAREDNAGTPGALCVFRNDTSRAVSPLRGTEVTPSRTFYYFTAPTVLECRAASTSIFRIPSSTELKMHFSLKKFLSPKPKKRNSSNNKKVHFDLIASPTRDSFKFHFNPVTGAAKADPKEKGLYKSIYMIYIWFLLGICFHFWWNAAMRFIPQPYLKWATCDWQCYENNSSYCPQTGTLLAATK